MQQEILNSYGINMEHRQLTNENIKAELTVAFEFVGMILKIFYEYFGVILSRLQRLLLISVAKNTFSHRRIDIGINNIFLQAGDCYKTAFINNFHSVSVFFGKIQTKWGKNQKHACCKHTDLTISYHSGMISGFEITTI